MNETLVELIRGSLNDELRKPKYKGNPNPMAGHCYVASETFYHLSGGKERFVPMVMRVLGDTHWFLKCRVTGEVIDLTADQFDFKIDYSLAKGSGFLTLNPSKRTLKVIDMIKSLTNKQTNQETIEHGTIKTDSNRNRNPLPRIQR